MEHHLHIIEREIDLLFQRIRDKEESMGHRLSAEEVEQLIVDFVANEEAEFIRECRSKNLDR